jgi:catechol 2,3-dioxygenase-like lactoylglutathione lyase family enzyme
VASGADIVLLGSAKNVLPYVFGVTKQVRRIQDLKGKVVGISQIGGRAGEIARMVIKNNGLDPDKDVVYLAVGGTMSRLAALATGKVQAAPISKGVVTAAQEKGLQIIEVEPIPLIIDALWTTRKYAEENPGLIYRVMRGYVAAIAAIIKDRPKTIAALRKYMRTADAKTPRWRLRELRRRSRSGADSQRAGDSEYPGNHLPHCAKACLAGNQEAALFRCGGTIAQRRLHRKTLQVKLKGDWIMARIRHLAIVSENRERLVKFYTEAFGMKVIDGVGPAIYLTDGYLNLAIIQKRPHYKEGLYHFGIEVDDIEKLKSVCKELGAASEIQKRPPNREAEYRVADPDGNLIDLSQHGWPA